MTLNEQFPGLMNALKARGHLVTSEMKDLPHKSEELTTFVTSLSDADYLKLLELLALVRHIVQAEERIIILT